MLRAVIPLMGAGRSVVDKVLADRFPGFAAILRTLHLLAKPTAGLRRVESVRIHR